MVIDLSCMIIRVGGTCCICSSSDLGIGVFFRCGFVLLGFGSFGGFFQQVFDDVGGRAVVCFEEVGVDVECDRGVGVVELFVYCLYWYVGGQQLCGVQVVQIVQLYFGEVYALVELLEVIGDCVGVQWLVFVE